MEARAAYYHVLLRAAKDSRGRFRPVIADTGRRWREVSNEGFKDETDAKDSAELMALAYIRREQPEVEWAKLKGVQWQEVTVDLCDFCAEPAHTNVSDASGVPIRRCVGHATGAAAG